ncbi:HEPN domain-containing protein [Parachryseolinea silvisoli]|uniref:HEPN domain-containing protein n=1 Tax=Parachryseolinea silvisoli TaxID=2873601 RepID=UPI002265E83D|nr:HEPN domain-containing protein [Parachryseolinea silvisoli]MCD9015704.1 hypothetical protein [Parachryseolinea silvisoli]
MNIQNDYKNALIAACDVIGLKIPSAKEAFTRLGKFEMRHGNFPYTATDIKNFGAIRLSRFHNNNPFLISVMEKEEAFKYYKVADTRALSLFLSNYLDGILSFLWFIKDNSIGAGCLLIEDQIKFDAPDNYMHIEDRQIRNSMASGIYQPMTFTKEEIDRAYEIYQRAKELMPNHILDRHIHIETPNPIANKNPLHAVDYNRFSRIERSLQFLTIARSFSFLPHKIAFYMAIYECLFSSDNAEIAHKVAYRASCYLGGKKEDKIANYEILKDAYNLRSQYIHGASLSKGILDKYKGIDMICVGVDTLTRQILTKVVMEDYEKFLLKKEGIDDWYSSLIFT